MKFPSRALDIALESERDEVTRFNAPIEAEIKRLEAAQELKLKPLREQLLEERLAALPLSIRDDLKGIVATPEEKRSDVQRYLADKFQDLLKITPGDLIEHFDEFSAELKKSQQTIDEQRRRLRPKPQIRALYDMGGEASASYLMLRGDPQTPGERVTPGVPSVLRAGLAPYKIVRPAANPDSSGRRLALARWLVQPNHPLTGRVMVNRIWMHHFGRGLVASPANFGRSGTLPSHPELLDWLATEFVHSGWSMKAMHRLIMTSNAYRQSSRFDPTVHKADPDNVLLSRMPMRRLEAEALYDSILKVTGSFDSTGFGPPAEIEVKPEGEVVAKGTKAGWRRSVYVLQRRRTPVTILDVFDQPPMSPNCIERRQSTVPTQALQMMNSDLVQRHSRYLAGRLIDEFGNDRERQIRALYLRAVSRPATTQEILQATAEIDALTKHWIAHLADQRSDAPFRSTAEWKALADFCKAMLSSAEFLYVD